MAEAPGVVEAARQWVVDPFWIAVIAALLAGYTSAFRDSRRMAMPHPRYRLFLFAAGLMVLALAVFSPFAHYGRQLLWVEFTGFLLLTMVVPPLILLGAPLTLAFRVASRQRRNVLRRIYRSKPVAVVTFPVVSWLLFAVTTYLWQFTSLTDEAAVNAPLRTLQQFTLVAVGVVFWLPALAADPVRWRLAYPLRALYVLLEMTHKALFGGMFLSMSSAMHSGFASRAPEWAPAAITDQRIAILILWIGGNLIFLVALVGIILRWMAYEQRNQHRTDRRLRLEREAAQRRRAALDQVFTKGI